MADENSGVDSRSTSLESEKLSLEISELRRDVEESKNPFWKQREFIIAMLTVAATLLVSIVSLAYTMFDQHFSEVAQVELSAAQLEQLQGPLNTLNLELRNRNLKLEGDKLELELANQRRTKEEVEAEIAEMSRLNSSLQQEIKDVTSRVRIAQGKLAETESELRSVGERIELAKASGVELGEELDRLQVDPDLKSRIMAHFNRVFGNNSVLSVSDPAIQDQRVRQLLAGTNWVLDDPGLTDVFVTELANMRNDRHLREGRPLEVEIFFAADGYALMRVKSENRSLPRPVLISSVDGYWEVEDKSIRVEFTPVRERYPNLTFEFSMEVDDIQFGNVPRLARILAGDPGGVPTDFRPAHVLARLENSPFGDAGVPLVRRSLLEGR